MQLPLSQAQPVLSQQHFGTARQLIRLTLRTVTVQADAATTWFVIKMGRKQNRKKES